MKKSSSFLGGWIILALLLIGFIGTYPVVVLIVALVLAAIFFVAYKVNKSEKISNSITLPTAPPKEQSYNPRFEAQGSLYTYLHLASENYKRIFSDSTNIIDKTKNLETFFSRYNLLISAADEAYWRNGIDYRNFKNALIAAFPKSLSNCIDRVIEDAKKLKTPNGRISRLNKNIDILQNARMEGFECSNEFNMQITRLKDEIISEQNVTELIKQ